MKNLINLFLTVIILSLTFGSELNSQCQYTKDQYQESTGQSLGGEVWQSFTPSLTGKLENIHIYRHSGPFGICPDLRFTLKVYSGEGTSGALLFSRYYDLDDRCGQWNDIDLPSNLAPTLTAGNKFTFHLSTTSGYIGAQSPGSYSGGVCNNDNNWDLAFRTYILPTDLTPPVAKSKNLDLFLDNNGQASITPAMIDNGSTDECEISSLSLSRTNFGCADLTNTTPNYALDFDGVDDRVVSSTSAGMPQGSSARTVEMWIKTTQTSAASLFSFGNFAYLQRAGLYLVSGRLYFVGEFNDVWGGNTLVNDGRWHHIAYTLSGKNIRFYIDGQFDFATTLSTFPQTTGAPWAMSNTSGINYTREPFIGQMDEVRVWSTVRSDPEISATFDKPLGGNEDNLVSYYTFDVGQGVILHDLTHNHNDGHLTNMAPHADWVAGAPLFNHVNRVVLTVTDGGGNTDISNALVNVIDNMPPSVQTKNITIQLDDEGNASITASDVDDGSIDNCSIENYSLSKSQFGCNDVSNGTDGVLSSNLSADNAFEFYISTDNNSVGNHLISGNNWSQKFSNQTNLIQGQDYWIHVKAIDYGLIEMFIGDFTLTGSFKFDNGTQTLGTNTNNWKVSRTGFGQNERTPFFVGAQGVQPWNNYGYSYNAYHIWDSVWNTDGSETVYFSTKITATSVSNLVTLTATDSYGNTASNTARVFVKDNTPPSVATQNVIVQLDSDGLASITANDVDNGSTDNCGITDFSLNESQFDCSDISNGSDGVLSSNLSVDNAFELYISTDNNSAGNQLLTGDNFGVKYPNQTNLTQGQDYWIHVKAIDQGLIEMFIGDFTLTGSFKFDNGTQTLGTNTSNWMVSSTGFGQNERTPFYAGAQGVHPWYSSGYSYGAYHIWDSVWNTSGNDTVYFSTKITATSTTSLVTLTATDASGNSTSNTARVIVKDMIPPTVMTQNVTVQLDSNGQASVTANDVNNGSTDNCGIASLSLSQTDFDCSDLGLKELVLTVTDNNGNESSGTLNVEIKDIFNPVAVCKNVTAQLDANGQASITANDIDGGSSDNCGITSMTVEPNTFDCNFLSTNPDNINISNPVVRNFAGRTVTFNGTTLNNSGNKIVVSPGALVSLNVAWNSQYTSNYCPGCIQQYYVGIQGIFVECLFSGSTRYNRSGTRSVNFTAPTEPGVYYVQTTSTLDYVCRTPGLSTSEDYALAAIVVAPEATLTVSDDSGNESSCKTFVFVEDNIAPTVISKNIELYLDANGNASLMPEDLDNGSFDNCGITRMIVVPHTFNCSVAGQDVDVKLVAYDKSGNVSHSISTVSIIDNTPPIVTTNNIVLNLDESGNGFVTAEQINNNSSDACGIASMSLSPQTFDCSNVGINEVILTVIDVHGNTASATANVEVIDNTPPDVATNDVVLYLDEVGNGLVTVEQINNNSFDACGIASMSLSQSMFDCSNVGINEVILTVIDVHGNTASATANVEVIDNTPPVVATNDVVLYLNEFGNGSVTAAEINNNSFDACGIASMSLSPTTFDCSNIGANEVILTVTDVNGNTASLAANVEVMDNTPPAVVTNDVVLYLNEFGNGSVTAADINNNSTDACGIALISLSQTTFDCSNIGTNEVILTVTDVNGNTAFATAQVTVFDNIFPVAICQSVTVYLDENGMALITADDVDNGSADNCSITTKVLSNYEFTCEDVGLNEVTLTVSDGSGNMSSCIASVEVFDNIAPVAVCQSVTVELDENGNGSISVMDVNNGSTDNCGIMTIELSKTDFDCSNVGTNSVDMTVTDVNGNTSSCTARIEVFDFIAPTAVCTNATIYLDENGTASVQASDIDDGSFDNCGISTLTLDKYDFSCNDLGVNDVVLTVLDVNGNTSTCMTTVTVLDVISPTISVSLSPNVLWPPNHKMQTITASVEFDDNCPISTANVHLVSVTSNEPDNAKGDGDKPNDIQNTDIGSPDFSFDLRKERRGKGNGRVYTIVYTVVDASGNETEATAYVNVSHDLRKIATYEEEVATFEGAKLRAYPNPASDVVNVEFNAQNRGNLNLRLMNITGEEMITINKNDIDSYDGVLNISDLPSGTYLIEIQFNLETKIIKVVKF